MSNCYVWFCVSVIALSQSACRKNNNTYDYENELQNTASTLTDANTTDQSAVQVDPLDLVPGTLEAYGLRLPLGSTERLITEQSRSYYVPTRMTRVNRYLQQQLSITNAEIHPLGMMIRGGYVRRQGQHGSVDVGVRDEGERTLITVWFHPDQAPAPARSTEEALRAAGVDPHTGRPLPENNH